MSFLDGRRRTPDVGRGTFAEFLTALINPGPCAILYDMLGARCFSPQVPNLDYRYFRADRPGTHVHTRTRIPGPDSGGIRNATQ